VTPTRINALKDEFKKRAEAQGAKFPEEKNCTPADNNSTHYCSNGFLREYGKVTDASGKTYKTVVIGTQTWMAENLNYDVEGSKCYDDDPNNCGRYGRLYNWMTAMALPNCNGTICFPLAKHKGICPSGYHIPTNEDWDKLYLYASENKYLKATVGWLECGSGSSYKNKCEDRYGFSALPSGYFISSFLNVGYRGYWWSATENNANYAYYRRMYYNDEYANSSDDGIKTYLFSVRCVQD